MSRTGTTNNVGHQVLKTSPRPTVSPAIDTYIGLRVNRYGPEITSAVAGRLGIGVVPARRNLPTLATAKATDPTQRIAATSVATKPSPTGSGHSRFRRTPPSTA